MSAIFCCFHFYLYVVQLKSSVFILLLLKPPLWPVSECYFHSNKLILELCSCIASGGRKDECVCPCVLICTDAVINQQLIHVFVYLCHHGRCGVNLRGIWVGHDKIHYARPRLCPHVA